jgi:hypothetical protein
MEHERGAFKVNSPDMLGAVKKSPETRPFPALRRSNCDRSDTMSCRKIRQMTYFAQKLYRLPQKNTFF